MALIVEDGTLVSGANSYVSFADANQYLMDRGLTPEVTLSEGHLLRGADYVNRFNLRFVGRKASPASSAMQWPRLYFYYEGEFITSNLLPPIIGIAQIESAYEIANDNDPSESAVDTPKIIRERVDVIETEYDRDSPQEVVGFNRRKIVRILRPVLSDNIYRVSR